MSDPRKWPSARGFHSAVSSFERHFIPGTHIWPGGMHDKYLLPFLAVCNVIVTGFTGTGYFFSYFYMPFLICLFSLRFLFNSDGIWTYGMVIVETFACGVHVAELSRFLYAFEPTFKDGSRDGLILLAFHTANAILNGLLLILNLVFINNIIVRPTHHIGLSLFWSGAILQQNILDTVLYQFMRTRFLALHMCGMSAAVIFTYKAIVYCFKYNRTKGHRFWDSVSYSNLLLERVFTGFICILLVSRIPISKWSTVLYYNWIVNGAIVLLIFLVGDGRVRAHTLDFFAGAGSACYVRVIIEWTLQETIRYHVAGPGMESVNASLYFKSDEPHLLYSTSAPPPPHAHTL